MSRRLQHFLSLETLSDSPLPTSDDNGLVLDTARANGDSPLIEIHGLKHDDSIVSKIRESMDDADALMVVKGQATMESQQQDSDILQQEESRSAQLAEVEQQAQDLINPTHKVYVLRGADPDDDLNEGFHATFAALNAAALDDPTKVVAAFLPIDGRAGFDAFPDTQKTRDEAAMMAVLRQKGVAVVNSLEGLADHLNFWHEANLPHISLEGYGIKLKPGMRVKYSGGHGKIIKVFNKPTKYKGEVHHCSPDNPKYEVKSEKGNKLSLHKAGALTPV